jgi:hypothetical protein
MYLHISITVFLILALGGMRTVAGDFCKKTQSCINILHLTFTENKWNTVICIVTKWKQNAMPIRPVNLCNDAYFPGYHTPSSQMPIHYCSNKLTIVKLRTLHTVRILSCISLNSHQIKQYISILQSSITSVFHVVHHFYKFSNSS